MVFGRYFFSGCLFSVRKKKQLPVPLILVGLMRTNTTKEALSIQKTSGCRGITYFKAGIR
jgi:hypothetical protein